MAKSKRGNNKEMSPKEWNKATKRLIKLTKNCEKARAKEAKKRLRQLREKYAHPLQ